MKKAIVSGLIVVFVMSLFVGLMPYDLVPTASAAGTKKAAIHIDNTAGSALSYYQVNLNITYDSDMNNNFSDIRVKNETAGVFVPYWVENKSDGVWCNLWFNATSLPASAWCNDTYYLYYGDAGASSESNGTNTFEFFDDFEGEQEKTEATTFGLIASTEFGLHAQPIDKIQTAVSAFNSWNPDFVIDNGDLIDNSNISCNATQALADLDTVEATYDNLTMNRYYIFGNHDIEQISKTDFFNHTGKSEKYHSFDVGGYHFIVLDDCFGLDNDTADHDAGNYEWDERYVPPNERTWLTNDLSNTSNKTFVFLEMPLTNDPKLLLNAAAVRTILENSGKVLAVFTANSGHNDETVLNGVTYYQIKAMDLASPNAYAKVRIYTDDTWWIEGIGEQASYGSSGEYNVTDKWNGTTARASVSSGIMTYNGLGVWSRMWSEDTYTPDMAWRARAYFAAADVYTGFKREADNNGRSDFDATNFVSYNDSGAKENTTAVYAYSTWYTMDILQLSGTEIKAKVDGDLKATHTTRVGTTAVNVVVGSDDGDMKLDWILTRKYISSEPTAQLGAEQTAEEGNASVTVTDGSITFGNLQLSATKNTVALGDTQVINTTGADGNQKIEIMLNSGTVTGTTNSTVLTFVSGSPGLNELLCQFEGGNVGSYTALTTSYQEFDNSMANDTNANLDIQLTTPTSVSNDNYYDDYQFEITVRATLL